jgi:hypothetical protein
MDFKWCREVLTCRGGSLAHPNPSAGTTCADAHDVSTRPRRNRPHRRRRYWSRHVTEHSNALDLEHRVFSKRSARAIAASLKRSAESSRRRKGTTFQSAMSMLTFYLNRAGRNLSPARRRTVEGAKRELRGLFGRA